MVRVKICGITILEDAVSAVEEGADAVGFVFYEKSKRYVSPYVVKRISEVLPPFVSRIGVFVNEKPEKMLEIYKEARLNAIQLHGNENLKICEQLNKNVPIIKAFRIAKDSDVIKALNYKQFPILFDTKTFQYGGSGKTFEWEILLPYINEFKYFIISGGLNPENVGRVVKLLSPFAVDVSSGVEKSLGKKDRDKMKLFIKNAKGL